MVSGRRLLQVTSSDDEEDVVAETRSQGQNSRRPEDDEMPTVEVKPDDVKPVGEPVKVTGIREREKTHYGKFEYNGIRYELEDTVLLRPDKNTMKPYIAIIKDITEKPDGRMMIRGQWFYRQEEAKKKSGGNWEINDLHHKEPPERRDNPGFVVQKVYDTVENKLWNLTDKVYDDGNQHEIDLFMENSMSRLGSLEPKLYHFV